jgi:hypothetical protein
MHTASAAEYAYWSFRYPLPLCVGIIAEVLFVRFYLGTGRDWLMWIVILTRLALVAVNVLVTPNVNFESINSISQVNVFGELVTVIESAVPRSWQWLAVLNCLLLVAYITDAALTLWRRRGAEGPPYGVACSTWWMSCLRWAISSLRAVCPAGVRVIQVRGRLPS